MLDQFAIACGREWGYNIAYASEFHCELDADRRKFILILNTLNTMNKNYHVGLVKRNSSTIIPLNNTVLINAFIQSIGKKKSRKEYYKFLVVIVKKFWRWYRKGRWWCR